MSRSLVRSSYYRIGDSWYHHISHTQTRITICALNLSRAPMAAVASQDHEERFHNHYILRKRETLRIPRRPLPGDGQTANPQRLSLERRSRTVANSSHNPGFSGSKTKPLPARLMKAHQQSGGRRAAIEKCCGGNSTNAALAKLPKQPQRAVPRPRPSPLQRNS